MEINYEEIDIRKYKEMLMATVKDALEIMSYDAASIFFGGETVTAE